MRAALPCRTVFLLALIASLVIPVLVLAQQAPTSPQDVVPPLVKFSGVLPGGSNPTLVTFALYAEASGGAPLWTETQMVEVDTSRRYTVLLGATLPQGLPPDLFTAGVPRWVGVRAGDQDLGRVLLTSAPYALKAADAETIAGKPLSAFVLAGEATGVGADGLTYVNRKTLGATFGTVASSTATAGTANYLAMFTDATNLGNSSIFQAPGTNYLGVGTSSPLGAFHSVAVGTTGPGVWYDTYTDTPGYMPVAFRMARGTKDAPAAIKANDILGGLMVRGYGATGFGSGIGQIRYQAAEDFTDSHMGTYLTMTTTPAGSAFWTERLRITSDGSVGIGTSAPAALLHVAGNIRTSGALIFGDGTSLVTAPASPVTYSAGTGLALVAGVFSVNFAGTGAAATVARSDHTHTVGQLSGVATLAANTFTATQTISSGNLALPATTSANSGVLTLGGQTFLHGYGGTNSSTFVGFQAGSFAATGSGANTGVGTQALGSNTDGYRNTAIGYHALSINTSGIQNTASGYLALSSNTTGRYNTASGLGALLSNTDGYWNTADGHEALNNNTGGYQNTACGASALYWNSDGIDNAATGHLALYGNSTGSRNTASGYNAMYGNSTGSSNIAIGASAGSNLSTGSYNIDIGHPGVAAEGNTIRIGTAGSQTRAFVAGIRGVTTGAANAIGVLIDSNGQLGTVSSSRRVKDDIADMDAASNALVKLRPVTFHYKADQNPLGRTLQYGLIAEEVADVYPGLVAHSADGQVETVMYQFLPPMLLNEYQKQQRTIDELRARLGAAVAEVTAENDRLKAQLAALAERLARLENRSPRSEK